MMADLKMSETTLATFRSASANSPLFRTSSPFMLRGSDCFSRVHAGGKHCVPARPEAPFTPDSVLLTPEPQSAVTWPTHKCKLAPCRFVNSIESAVHRCSTHEAENFNARSISRHPCRRIDRNSLDGPDRGSLVRPAGLKQPSHGKSG